MSPVSPVSPAKKLQKKNRDVIFFSCHQCHRCHRQKNCKKKWRCDFFSCHQCHRCHRQVLIYETIFNICDFNHVTGVTGVTGKKIAKKNRDVNFFSCHQCHRQKIAKKMEWVRKSCRVFKDSTPKRLHCRAFCNYMEERFLLFQA